MRQRQGAAAEPRRGRWTCSPRSPRFYLARRARARSPGTSVSIRDCLGHLKRAREEVTSKESVRRGGPTSISAEKSRGLKARPGRRRPDRRRPRSSLGWWLPSRRRAPPAGLRIGIAGGGRSPLSSAHVRPGVVGGLGVAQLPGGVDAPRRVQGHELVRRMAELFPGSRATTCTRRRSSGGDDARRVLLADRTVKRALDAARRSEVALVGVGAMDEGSTLYSGGHVSREDGPAARGRAVGNVNTRFFDAMGSRSTCSTAYDRDQLGRAARDPDRGGRRRRRRAGRRDPGALATRSIDILVTNGATAEAMLNGAGPARRVRSAARLRGARDEE